MARPRRGSSRRNRNGQDEEPVINFSDGDTAVVELKYEDAKEVEGKNRQGRNYTSFMYSVVANGEDSKIFASPGLHKKIQELRPRSGDTIVIERDGTGLDTEWIVDYSRDSAHEGNDRRPERRDDDRSRGRDERPRDKDERPAREESQPQLLSFYQQSVAYINFLGQVRELAKTVLGSEPNLRELNAIASSIQIASRHEDNTETFGEWAERKFTDGPNWDSAPGTQGPAKPSASAPKESQPRKTHVDWVKEQLEAADIHRTQWLMVLRNLLGEPGLKSVASLTKDQAIEIRRYISEGADLSAFIEGNEPDSEPEEFPLPWDEGTPQASEEPF